MGARLAPREPSHRAFNMMPSMHVFDTCMAAIRLRTQNPEARKDILEQWKEQLGRHPYRMEEKQIVTNAARNLGVGSDTVSSVLPVFVYHMIHGPEMLDMLRKELDEAKLAHIPTYEETQKLPVMQACIKET
jgi:cytochrome P450